MLRPSRRGRSARLQAAAAQAKRFERFTQQHRRRLAAASRGILLLATMDDPVQKRSGGDDHGLRADDTSITQLDATDDARAFGRKFALRCSLFALRQNPIVIPSEDFSPSRGICGC